MSFSVHHVHQKGIVAVLCDFRPECFNFAKSNSYDRKNSSSACVCVRISALCTYTYSRIECHITGKAKLTEFRNSVATFELNDKKMHLVSNVCACYLCLCLCLSALYRIGAAFSLMHDPHMQSPLSPCATIKTKRLWTKINVKLTKITTQSTHNTATDSGRAWIVPINKSHVKQMHTPQKWLPT